MSAETSPDPQITEVPTTRLKVGDLVAGNPYVHFIMSESWGALAGMVVYAIFRGAAYLTQRISTAIPLQNQDPSNFLQNILSWGGVFEAGATFIIVTLYQLIILVMRLREEVRK